MNNYSQNLLKAKSIVGSFDALGRVCGGISGKAVMKWNKNGKPPRTEYTGETNYAELIEKATDRQVIAQELIPNLVVKSKHNAGNDSKTELALT